MITKLRNLSWPSYLLLAESLVCLGVARIAILVLPFKRVAAVLGEVQKETPLFIAPDLAEKAETIGWAIRAAARRTPWESACLVQAIAVQAMLRFRNIPATVYLGVAKDEALPKKLKAHAWVRCGKRILTGAEGHQKFTVVSRFSC